MVATAVFVAFAELAMTLNDADPSDARADSNSSQNASHAVAYSRWRGGRGLKTGEHDLSKGSRPLLHTRRRWRPLLGRRIMTRPSSDSTVISMPLPFGPRPTPSVIKMLHGNPGHRPLNKLEPRPQIKLPPMPKGMSTRAKALFKFYGRKLVDLRIVSVLDGHLLAAFCSACALWEHCEKAIAEQGTDVFDRDGTKRRNPNLLTQKNATDTIDRLGSALGLSPSARAKLIAEPGKRGFGDPIEAILYDLDHEI
jgi:P27 family predicted phage terminase small subunit